MKTLLDKYGKVITVGDFVMIGLKCNSMGDVGEVLVSKVTDINGYGALIEGNYNRVKVAHRLTKVSPLFAKMWKDNTIFDIN
ncbi:hypothetical protein FDI23_gp271 [Serratia phage CHI14]|uniref:Uncharacterized protein n=2 Tax=Winklervirus chi14 TaxID=2560752 RepID=A0A1Z1LYG8_9CAUD|nr:hypothetical protein FDI23_gp271 [Serratia phage CHI14]ARW57567.1 hypothetical protein [Serratia phage CHI14]ARW57842.1 hypothetical protein [Serratia phage CBH8]